MNAFVMQDLRRTESLSSTEKISHANEKRKAMQSATVPSDESNKQRIDVEESQLIVDSVQLSPTLSRPSTVSNLINSGGTLNPLNNSASSRQQQQLLLQQQQQHLSNLQTVDGRKSTDNSNNDDNNSTNSPSNTTPGNEHPNSATRPSSSKINLMIGLICIITCVLGSVIQTGFLSYMSSTESFNQPFLLLYVAHSSFILMIPISFAINKEARARILRSRWTFEQGVEHQQQEPQTLASHLSIRVKEIWLNYKDFICTEFGDSKFSNFFRNVALLSVLYNIPNGLWYLALVWTSMAEVTAIFNCNSMAAYLFSILLLSEPFKVDKFLTIFVALIGIVLIAFGDGASRNSEQQTTAIYGDAIAALSAMIYGFYGVYYTLNNTRKRNKQNHLPQDQQKPSELYHNHLPINNNVQDINTAAVNNKNSNSNINGHSILYTNQVTGWIGVTTLLLQWFPIPLFNWLGWETIGRDPFTKMQWILLISNTTMSVLYNTLYMVN